MDTTSAVPVVLETLRNACCQNADILKPAEKQLQSWETQPGFYTILSEIFCNHSIDTNVRWLAVLYCKNGVDRYWRRNAPNAIAEEEKDSLKVRLLSNFNEPVPQIATQLAVLIAKIARYDCPRNWSQLLPTLFEAVRHPEDLLQQRALLVLHHVTKTIASKRLASDRKLFEDLTKEIFGFISSLWISNLENFQQLAFKHDSNMLNALDKSILTCKILRKQIAFGFKEPGENEEVVHFLNQIFTRLKEMLDCRRTMWGHHQILEKCEKMITLLSKILLDLLEMHPVTFVRLIQPTLQFTTTYNFSHTEKELVFERFTVNCFNLIKGILLNDMYRPTQNSTDIVEPIRSEAHRIKMEFFTFDTLSEICRRLVSEYFLFSNDDLNTWDTDPEEFCQEEGGDSYKYSLRPSTECLFLTLFKEFRTSLSPVLLDIVRSLQGPCDPEDLMTILRKDAVYNAVGLAAFDLFDDISFDEWFTTHLMQELQNKHVNYRIIRRRVIWLCGQWVGVKMSASLRPTLYQVIIPLLDKEEDLVVRLEAAGTLKTAVDDFEFSTEQFLPYLETSFTLLFELLKEVHECDTKMQVLHVISFVIERVGSQIRPYTSSLMQYLPALWQESADHNMLKCAILTTLIHLVQGFSSHCTEMYDFLLPIIQMSTDVTQDQHVYLMEDGLELWQVTLHNSPVITDKLLELYKNMPGLLELGTENLRICLKVIEAYIYFCPHDFMQQFSQELVTSLGSLMTDIRTEGLVLILRVIELVFKTFPTEGPKVFQPLLPKLFNSLLDEEEHPVVLTMYVTLFARILLQNQDYMWTFLNRISTDLNKDSKSLLGKVIDTFVDKIDNMAQPEKRKLVALAVTSLLSVNVSTVMDKFAAIINICVEVLHDVTRIPVDEDTVLQMDSLVISDQDDNYGDDNCEEETEHDKRKRLLLRKDPVHTIPLKDFLISQLSACQQLHGQVTFNRLMEQVDTEITQQLHEFATSF